MLRLSKAADIDSTHNQLTMVWNRLNVTLRQHIPEPTQYTSLSGFLEKVDSMTSIWQEMSERQGGGQYGGQQYQQPHRQAYNQQAYNRRPPDNRSPSQQQQGGQRPPSRIPVDGGKHAYLADVDEDGVGYYNEEDLEGQEVL